MNNYGEFLAALHALRDTASEIPLGGYKPISLPELSEDAPVSLLFPAHPDDEWLSFMPLGLKLQREGYRLVVVPVTLGRPEQYDRRLRELKAACEYGGMELCVPGSDGKGLRKHLKAEDGYTQSRAVVELSGLLKKYKPRIVITHHDNDGHHDHIAVNRLVRAAIGGVRSDCYLVETEYWNDLDPPNCQLELHDNDVVQILQGVSFHKEELERNPYHLTFPLLAMLNAQYAERVMGWGKPAAAFRFSVMLRLRKAVWGKLEQYEHPHQLTAEQPTSLLFP